MTATPIPDGAFGGAPPTRFYRALRGLVRGALRVFYRTVEVTGRENVVAGRPTILASNHPNSIIDPLLVGLFEERPVTFCARDGLFKVPGFGRLLRAVGAVPIRRASDHGGKASNVDAFAACRAVLKGGGVLSIFPEGKTHSNLAVQEIKTGTARIALDAELDSAEGIGLQIVPVGLNYLVRQAFRSDVHVAFGRPIPVAEFRAHAEQDPRAAVRELTDRVAEALKAVAIHVEQAEDERIIAQVTAIVVDIRRGQGLDAGGQTPAERTALVRRIVDAYRWYQDTQPERTAELRRRLAWYVEERSALGLGGDSAALQHRSERAKDRRTARRRRRVFLVLGAPVAVWGLLHSALPYWLLRVLLRLLKPRKDRQALTKLLLGTLVYGGAWAFEVVIVGAVFGPIAAAIVGATLPPSAIIALRYFTELRLHRLTWRSLRALWEERGRVDQLRHEREALEAIVSEMRDAYLAHIGQ